MYKAAYPELAAKPDHPQTYMPYGIPPAMSLVKALQDAGPNPTREKVLAAMKTQDFDSGVMAGRMQFGPEQRAANRSTIFIKYDGTTMAPLPGVFTSRWTYQAK
jgi:branched-chain amino acid transport system substrate-binding protein